MKSRDLLIALMGSTFALSAAAIAETATACPMQPDKLTIATENAKQLMLLMDTDKNGKISKSEWIEFMSAEFDLLDVDNRSGELDPHQLLQSQAVSFNFKHARQACPSGSSGQVVGPDSDSDSDSAEPAGNEILQHKEWFEVP
jgi:EF hand